MKRSMLSLCLAAMATLSFANAAQAKDGSKPIRPWQASPGLYACNTTFTRDGWWLDPSAPCTVGNSGDLAKLIADRAARFANAPLGATCIGRDIGTCLWTLSRTIVLAGSQNLPITIRQPKVDISGSGQVQLLSLPAWYPGDPPPPREAASASAPGFFFVVMGPDFVVQRVSGELSGDFLTASTKEDFDQTHVYEVAQAIMGSECVGPDRLAFYRTLKDALKYNGASRDYDKDGIHDFSMRTALLCGYKVRIEASSLTDGLNPYSGVGLVVTPANEP